MHAGIQIKSKIEYFLQRDGYQKMATDVPEYTLFFRFENQMVYAFMIVDATQNRFLMPDQYRQMKEAMAGPFTARGISDVHIQSLILAEDTESAKNICQNDIFSWIVDVVNEKLMIFEDKVADFYGMASKIEKYLTIEVENYFPEGSQQSVMEGSIADRPAKYIFWINRTLLLLNSVIFLVCMATGDLLYNLGDLNGPSTLGDGEWYRFLTSMFLHGSMDHLVGNMLFLYFFGDILEKILGHTKYVILYMLAGIGSGFVSVWMEYVTNNFTPSIGASGAIFGLVGAFIYIIIRQHGRAEGVTLPRILFLTGYSIYSGLVSTNVDNAAHIGGLFFGFFLGIFLYHTGKQNHVEKNQMKQKEVM